MAFISLSMIIASAFAAKGIHSSARAFRKNKKAKDVNNSAQQIFDSAKKSMEEARKKSNKSLERLGKAKLHVLNNTIADFVSVFGQIHDVQFQGSAGLNELGKMHFDEQDISKMKEMSNLAGSVLRGLSAGAGAGALAAFGAYGAAMTFGTASTGTAIASLRGIAAKSATLAFLGGGAITAGGGGMALGSVVIGGVAAGPAIAILGIVLDASASKNLDNAYSNKAEAEKAAEGFEIIEMLCNAVTVRTNMFAILLVKLEKALKVLIERMRQITQTKGCDYSYYTEEEQNVLAMALSLATAIKGVLDTPILDEDGKVTEESEDVHARASERYKHILGISSLSGCSLPGVATKPFSIKVLDCHKEGENYYRIGAKVLDAPVYVGDLCVGYGSNSCDKGNDPSQNGNWGTPMSAFSRVWLNSHKVPDASCQYEILEIGFCDAEQVEGETDSLTRMLLQQKTGASVSLENCTLVQAFPAP